MNFVLSFTFLKNRRFQIVTAIFILQWAALLGFTRDEVVPAVPPLRVFPEEISTWKLTRDAVIESEALSILQPDDYIVREYYDRRAGAAANLFVAYFRTQRNERMPHSPKNCLPGSGWVPSDYTTTPVAVPGASAPISVNSYVVRKEDRRAVVLYWYQTWNRSVANEYAARAYLALDSIRYNRTDTGLVRVMVDVPEGESTADYHRLAVDFAREVYPKLAPYFPPNAR
jgi:EpsI family protein